MTDTSLAAPAAVAVAARQPAYVPDALVYNFDLFLDTVLRGDAHARVLDLIQHAPPIFWTPRNGMPEFRLDEERPTTFLGGRVIGPETLHLRWDA